ncbi:MAG: hypothetical protein GXP55_21155 [Deltaproteobacteria bacterium]|nr:hypothetical protein [Deltaproteobacteria bacterium]
MNKSIILCALLALGCGSSTSDRDAGDADAARPDAAFDAVVSDAGADADISDAGSGADADVSDAGSLTDAGGADASGVDASVDGGPTGVIFETNFASDGDYSRTGASLWEFDNVPTGWDGVRTNRGTIRGVPGAGIDGSVALKFEWPASSTALATNLGKHLTGDPATGYPELYIRYQVRLPGTFTAGIAPSALPYWKWGRLWQNTGLNGDNWTENRTDSYFIVWNWGSGIPKWGIRNNLTFSENLNTNDRGSSGSPRTGTDWYVSGSDTPGYHRGFDGHWDHVGGGEWEFDHSTRRLLNSTQTWHTFEWRFKLSSTDTSNDGVFQVWFDGEEQFCPNAPGGIEQSVDRVSTTRSLLTAAKPGFNFLSVMDNMARWSEQWDEPGVEGGIYFNDVVVSTDRIGPSYVAGNTF